MTLVTGPTGSRAPRLTDMLNISKRARLMLDLLFGVSAALALLMALDVGLEMWWGRGVAVALAVLAAVGAWVTWRRHDGAADRAVLVLVSCAFVVALVGDGPSGLPFFFVALIVLIVEHGSLAGLAAAAALVIGLVLVMAVAYRRPLDDIVPQSIGVLVLLALGLLIAQLVRETDQSRRENARLLAELRASLDSEKDLVLAQERARSASDLHDGLGHQLTAIQMGLDFADRMRTRDPHAAWEEVGRARDLSAVALDRMRVWVRALDPVPVGSLTGTAALEAVADAFRGTGLEVSVTTLGAEQPLDRERALFCLRVVQEGLTNALRHGGARRVDLVVDHADGLTLTLTDDGSAPETGDAEVATGYGLRSLTQRATRLGGDIDAGWSPDGFRLRAHLPKESA